MKNIPISGAQMYQKSYEFAFDEKRSYAHNIIRMMKTKMTPGDMLRFEVPESVKFASDVTRNMRRTFREKGVLANTSTHGRMVTVIFNGLKGE